MKAKTLGEKNPKPGVYPYSVVFTPDISIADLILWGHENLRSESWMLRQLYAGCEYFDLEDDTDLMLIRLRWPDAEYAEFDAAGCWITH